MAGLAFYTLPPTDDREIDTVTASSNSGNARNTINRKTWSRWLSIGENTDADTSTISYTLRDVETMGSFFFLNHNFKNFELLGRETTTDAYLTINAWSGVTTNTTYLSTSSYVAYKQLEININETQIADSEKYIYNFMACRKYGQFSGFPTLKPVINKKAVKGEKVDGRTTLAEFGRPYWNDIRLKNYYHTTTDYDLFKTIWDLEEEFLIWPCGGDVDNFKYSNVEGWRYQDIYLVVNIDMHTPKFTNDITILGINTSMKVREV